MEVTCYAPYSYSKLQRGACPLSFKLRYIDKVEGEPGPNSNFGKDIHNAVAEGIKNKVYRRQYSVEDLLRRHLSHRSIDRIDEAREVLDIFEKQFKFDQSDVAGIEEKIAIARDGTLTEWDSSYLRGVLDLIEICGTHARITDHKTQFNILSDDEMDQHQQLTFYCLLAKKAYPQLESFTVRIYFARYGCFRSSQRTMDQIEMYRQHLSIRIKMIESIQEWIPIPGATCMYCEYMNVCPLAKFDSRNTAAVVMGDNDAVALNQARLLKVRKEQIKRIESALKAYCAEYGPIEVSSDFQFGFFPTVSHSWKTKAAYEALKSAGQDPMDTMRVQATAMKKLINMAKRLDPELYEALTAITETKVSTQFKGKGK